MTDETADRPTQSALGGETSQTMDRGLALLARLTSGAWPHGATVTELAAELGVGRPVVYRLLASLARHDLVARRSDGRIGPGLGLLRLAVSARPLVVEAAVPVLRELADRVGATAHLTLAEQGDALAVAVVEPTSSDFHVAYRVGSRHPLGSGAAGRAILLGREVGRHGLDTASPSGSAYSTSEAASGSAYSTSEAASGSAYSTSEAAYVATDGELQAGAHGLAAPVRGVPGLEASVGVVSLQALDDTVVGPVVAGAADALAAALGRQG